MAKVGEITVNVKLNGTIDVDKIMEEVKESIRREIARVGVSVEGGPSYRKVPDREPRVGDFVKFSKADYEDITVGKYYKVIRIDCEGDPEFYNDEGDIDVAVDDEEFYVYEKVGGNPPETLKVGDYAKVVRSVYEYSIGDIVRISDRETKSFSFAVDKINCAKSSRPIGFINASDIVKATDEDVAEAKAKLERKATEDRWSKIGRKPNEFKEGDFVRVVVENEAGSRRVKGYVGEITQYSHNESFRVGSEDAGWMSSRAVELVTPVEARFDR